MNLHPIQLTALTLLTISLAAPTFAQDFSDAASLPSVSVLSSDPSSPSADPTCDADHSVTVHTTMEFQDGLFAWRPVGNWEICVNDGGTSQITVNFKDEAYQAIILINGHHVDMAAPANNGWAFEFTRQDMMSGKNYGPVHAASFVLNPHHRDRFELGGHFYTQERNLRFTVAY